MLDKRQKHCFFDCESYGFISSLYDDLNIYMVVVKAAAMTHEEKTAKSMNTVNAKRLELLFKSVDTS